MNLDCYLFTSQGGRSCNQDSIGKAETDEGGVFVVADGLGGHLHGEQAAQCVVDTLLDAAHTPPAKDLLSWLNGAIDRANANILELQAEHNCNMKSTVAALAISGTAAVWANVGDSRLYYLHSRKIERITEDHSVAYRKYKDGEISRAEIGTDEDQASLLRALGNRERGKPDSYRLEYPLAEGDGFLLCSDGLWEYVLDEEILVEYLKAGSAREWGEHLLLRAMERIRPGNDNLSLITVLIPSCTTGGSK